MIWRKLKREDVLDVSTELDNIFMERGPVNELLMGSSTTFWLQCLRDIPLEYHQNV